MISIDLNKFLNELETLISLESPSDYPLGVEKIAKFFKQKYEELNWNVKLEYSRPDTGPNLLITNGEFEYYDVFLIGHMDTVYPLETVNSPPIKYEENIALGPGVGDMKGNLLLNYYAIKEISKLESQPKICILYNSDEEIGSRSSSGIIRKIAAKSKIVMVLEGGRMDGALVHRRKGIAKYDFNVIGRAAHAGANHQLGLNSIDEFCTITKKLHSMTDYSKGTTLNVGVVRGGTKSNVVPELTYGEVDIRFETKDEFEKIKNVIEELTLSSEKKGFKVEFISSGIKPPMNPSKNTELLMGKIEEIGKSLNMPITWASTGGVSDANTTSDMGIPTLDGFGLVGGFGHSEKEYIELDSIEPRANLIYQTILMSKDLRFE